jgi:hypothetical protein
MILSCFINKDALLAHINAYFSFIEGEYHLESKPGKITDEPAPTHKVWDRDPEPATFSGLALFLGFNSIRAFEDYIETGELSDVLKWGRLRIEASYERKLHAQSATGAIFALKYMGWNERTEAKQTGGEQLPKTIKVEILESGPKPAESERDVIL